MTSNPRPFLASLHALKCKSRLKLFLLLSVCILVPGLMPSVLETGRASAQVEIELGSEVEVTGTGDCLNVRADTFLNAALLECLADGTRARVAQGPQRLREDTLWYLAGHGWANDSWLRVTAPPEPDLSPYAGARPYLPGMIAYIGNDNNVRLARPDGTDIVQITRDGAANTSEKSVNTGLQWSLDGRLLAFLVQGDQFGVWDAASGEVRFIDAPPGRSFGGSFHWFDERHLWVIEGSRLAGPCGAFRDTSIQSLDVWTEEYELIARASSESILIRDVGLPSPNSLLVAYLEVEQFGCEVDAPKPCVLSLASGMSRCFDERISWPPEGWINNRELLLFDTPSYGFVPPEGIRGPIALDALSGNARPANELDLAAVVTEPGPKGGFLVSTPRDPLGGARYDFYLNDGKILHVPEQQKVSIQDQALAPNEEAFVFLLRTRASDFGQRLWVGLTDGSEMVWPISATYAGFFAWQPRVLPPVLFVHGCGGSLGTWTDPGWIANTKEVAQLMSGQASGVLHRGIIPDLPVVPAYALDYGRSEGSIWDLAALLPQSIDKIVEETGVEEVMVVTHSMGGVLTQAYVGGLATGRRFENDVEAAFMVAPPSRGAFGSNWLTGLAGNELVCPQASELGPNSQSIARLRAASLPQLDYAVISGTRFWIPFVGLNDGIVADHDVGLDSAPHATYRVDGTHVDLEYLHNTIAALCQTVPGLGERPCIPELEMQEVGDLFRQHYQEDMFE